MANTRQRLIVLRPREASSYAAQAVQVENIKGAARPPAGDQRTLFQYGLMDSSLPRRLRKLSLGAELPCET
jgi:hypothetical protein